MDYMNLWIAICIAVPHSSCLSHKCEMTKQDFLATSFLVHKLKKRGSKAAQVNAPTALATSETSAPVASQIDDMALMLEIRWARKALAASLVSSDDHVSIVKIFSEGSKTR